MRQTASTDALLRAAWSRYGILGPHTLQLVKAGRTLRRWYEAECGESSPQASWAIERDEETGRPFRVFQYNNRPVVRTPIPDRERGAMRRIDAILKQYPGVLPYYQTDPRGATLYLYRAEELPPGSNIESCYNLGLCMDA